MKIICPTFAEMISEEMWTPKISIIISTYNSEKWLEKVLWGFNCQTFKQFEVVIADDGSGLKTKSLLDSISIDVFYKIVHVWQEDDGFQKSRILNKAVVACNAEYILMTDGDCIPRKDFVETHFTNREEGYFISGGYFMLPMNISKQITKTDIEQQLNIFNHVEKTRMQFSKHAFNLNFTFTIMNLLCIHDK